MNMEDLCGKHHLDGVNTGFSGDAAAFFIRLDGRVYMFEEDESDGYRSSLKSVEEVDPGPTLVAFRPVDVDVALKPGTDVIVITNLRTDEVILEIGTDDYDGYYPMFVCQYHPENL